MSKNQTNAAMDKFREGEKRAKLGGYLRALPYYKKAIELDPNNPEFYSHKGIALQLLGWTKEAIKCYEKAIELDPNNHEYLNRLNTAQSSLNPFMEYDERDTDTDTDRDLDTEINNLEVLGGTSNLEESI